MTDSVDAETRARERDVVSRVKALGFTQAEDLVVREMQAIEAAAYNQAIEDALEAAQGAPDFVAAYAGIEALKKEPE